MQTQTVPSRRVSLGVTAAFLALAAVTACAPDPSDQPRPEDLGDAEAEAWAGNPAELLASRRPVTGTTEDWLKAGQAVGLAKQMGLDSLPHFGDLVGAIGEQFVGTPYQPGTLDIPGEERLVINLEGLDCVTFVENALALARVAATAPDSVLYDSTRFELAVESELQALRYRDGLIEGYSSRLHYFSEWISNNQSMGLVEDITGDLGGVREERPIDFMSTHSESYPQLSDPTNLEAIEAMEDGLNQLTRFFIPEDELESAQDLIMNGDIIAATSATPGLDIAHTGLALWRNGTLRLLHAPLVDGSVELTEEPLVDRIRRIPNQTGIMVARPSDPRDPPSGN